MTGINELKERVERLKSRPYLMVDFPSDKHLTYVQQPHRFKAFLGGNRSGKTETSAIEVIWHLTGEHPFYEVKKPPVRWRVHVVDFNQLEKVVEEKFRRYIPDTLLKGGDWETAYSKRMHLLKLSNGSAVDFTTHRTSITALEGASLDGVWIDEECPLQQFRALQYRVLDKKGKIFVSATPIHGVTWIYEEIVRHAENGDENYYVDYVSVYDNKYIEPEVIKQLEEKASPEEREIRIYGRIMNFSSRVFYAFNKEKHVVDFPPPNGNFLWFVGLDWGFFHPSAVLFCVLYGDIMMVVREYFRKNIPLERVGEEIEDALHELGVSPSRVRVVYDSALNRPLPDGTRREIDLLRRFGFRLVPSSKSLPLTISTTNQCFEEDRLLIHPTCTQLIGDLQKLYAKNGKISPEDPAKDICDALRYVVYYMETNRRGLAMAEEEAEDLDFTPSAKAKIIEAIRQRRSTRKQERLTSY